jgi:hypothetical protein
LTFKLVDRIVASPLKSALTAPHLSASGYRLNRSMQRQPGGR